VTRFFGNLITPNLEIFFQSKQQPAEIARFSERAHFFGSRGKFSDAGTQQLALSDDD
jgi:hypothetical protein